MEKHLQIKVFGRVQGVYFRQSTKDKAVSLGLRGVVMNEADGSVFISATGSQGNLEMFLTFCKIGPPAAKVENVIVEEVDLQEFPDFRVIS